MKTATPSLAIMIALAAGCARPGTRVTPAQRATAFQLYLNGASPDQIATQLAIAPDDARAVVRTSLMSLMRRYQRER